MRTRTKQSKVTRGFRDARAGQCEMLTKGGRKAGHVAVNALRVAYLRDVGELGERSSGISGSQVCEHGATDRQFPGHERSELYTMTAVTSHSSASSSDFAQPKSRPLLVGSTS